MILTLTIISLLQLFAESQSVTSLELKCATQSSRVAELEGNLGLASEKNTNLSKELLLLQERHNRLIKEFEGQTGEIRDLSMRLSVTEHKLVEAERRVETLASVQSQRWMEFAKMADSMKDMSNDMLKQSKTNTRRAANVLQDDELMDN